MRCQPNWSICSCCFAEKSSRGGNETAAVAAVTDKTSMADQPKSMVAPGKCAVCGRSVPANAPGGLCPGCLLERGVRLATSPVALAGDFVPPAAAELAILFPEFEIIALVGRGGMGAVYQAV